MTNSNRNKLNGKEQQPKCYEMLCNQFNIEMLQSPDHLFAVGEAEAHARLGLHNTYNDNDTVTIVLKRRALRMIRLPSECHYKFIM